MFDAELRVHGSVPAYAPPSESCCNTQPLPCVEINHAACIFVRMILSPHAIYKDHVCIVDTISAMTYTISLITGSPNALQNNQEVMLGLRGAILGALFCTVDSHHFCIEFIHSSKHKQTVNLMLSKDHDMYPR